MAGMPIARTKQAARATGTACLKALGRSGTPADPGAAPATASSAPSPTAPRPSAPLAPGAHAANWSKVQDVYFRSYTGFGVGGGVTIEFEPIILFKDGSYYEIEGPALEDVDLAASRAANPRKWGRWKQQGNMFTLINSQGKSRDHTLQQGSFFKAFPASGPEALTGSYKTIGGGGNSAIGGDVTIATKNVLTFLPGGGFTNQRSTGAINGGGWTGVGSAVSARSGGQGRFKVDRYTLVIDRPDGQRERKFFAFGSRKTPAQIATSMIFYGSSVYTRDD
jgi:hypothetical protein